MDPTGTDPLVTLEQELNTWRKTSFDRLLVRRDSLPALRKAAQHAGFDVSKAQWQEQVRAFLVSVVAARDQSTGTSGGTNATLSNPAAISEIFGLTQKSRDASVATRWNNAGERVGEGQSGHTLRRDLRAYSDQLALWIRTYLDERPTSLEQNDPATSLIVIREEDLTWLRETYKTLQEQHGGVFQLWGIAGVGKTVLAGMLADRVGPEHAVGVVRIGRRGLYENDVRLVVRREGVDDSLLSEADCLTEFWKLAATYRANRPTRLLVLDGVETPEEVIELLPRGVTIPTLVTARKRLRFPGDAPKHLRIIPARRLSSFDRRQSVELLQRSVLDLDVDMANKFAEAVGHHPESLVHVAHCLRLSYVTPTELLEDIHRRPRQTLIAMTHALDVPDCAANAIETLLRQLDPASLDYAILTCVIWAEEFGQLPRSFVLELVTVLRGERPTQFAVHAALNRLEQLGLLGATNDSLRMSRMTCQILRDLTVDQCAPVLVAYERLISTEPDDPTRKDLLSTLRLEYSFARPLQDILAEYFPADRPPALVCIDQRNWALFDSDSRGVRHVTMYRVTPGALLRLDTVTRKGWEVIPEDASGGLIRSAERYHQLVSEGFEKR